MTEGHTRGGGGGGGRRKKTKLEIACCSIVCNGEFLIRGSFEGHGRTECG